MKTPKLVFLFSIVFLNCLGQKKEESWTPPKDAVESPMQVSKYGKYLRVTGGWGKPIKVGNELDLSPIDEIPDAKNAKKQKSTSPDELPADFGFSDIVDTPKWNETSPVSKKKNQTNNKNEDLLSDEVYIDTAEYQAIYNENDELPILKKKKPAKIAFVVGKDTYDIPTNEVKDFLKAMPNAKALVEVGKSESIKINVFGYVLVFPNWKYILLAVFVAFLLCILLWYLIKKIIANRAVISSAFQKILAGIKSAMNWKVGVGFIIIIVILTLTNPSLTAFKSYAESEYPIKKMEDHESRTYRYYSRQSYWLVFSRYQVKVACDEYAEEFKTHTYTGIFNNFILDFNDKWKECESVQ